jgi:hypothetical protein
MEVMREMEKYYTEKQLEQLAERARKVGPERIAQVEKEWGEVFAGFDAEMKKGSDPAEDACRRLAEKAQALIAEFTGGDPNIRKSLDNAYQQEKGAKISQAQAYGVDPAVFEFMGQAMEALKNE